ncbi:MAG: helix-turn-helix transcriptional regulator [Ruminococcaceae bacterium]|nr:helix-turn-helix transcriptional regulator [Oscillospiraceae bacterium]
MYIDYSKLWKLLIDKDMTKSDLMQLTGISSRVLAKLSKNETVTTDTISRICSALNCDVGDIMECASENKLSVYACYKKYGKCVGETEFVKIISVSVGEQDFTVYVSKQSANAGTYIRCAEDKAVWWEQVNSIGTLQGSPIKNILVKPTNKNGETVIVLIKGKPNVITGLDENGFVSSRSKRQNITDVYVMSETAFKLFEP